MTLAHPDQLTLPIYWAWFRQDEWRAIVAATDKGVCYIGLPEEGEVELQKWCNRQFPGHPLQHNEPACSPYVTQLGQYLKGERTAFTFACDLRGTPFQLAVWQALLDIGYGETRAYSEIAAQIGKPAAVRAVGAAIGANPITFAVPCHRIIGKSGALTGYRGGLALKARLLRLEEALPATYA